MCRIKLRALSISLSKRQVQDAPVALVEERLRAYKKTQTQWIGA
ncbi:hypothetical protein EV184_12296 [Sinorhizobium americanum]|uniref:Uncharacterized protein n=1 Tax=Sinorhizobium americanum TaxID=194963 RepID=A0A4R2B961_9HYPH|nr:hypothetical protein EV184_12296 [Sinorhizobium americanum]